MFFVWFDDTPRKLTTDKLDEAINAYIVKFTQRPSHVLVNLVDKLDRSDVVVGIASTVQPNSFWLSFQDTPPVLASAAN